MWYIPAAMKFEYSHRLTLDDAKTRLVALGEYLTNRHKIGVTWDGDTATFEGRFKKVVRIYGELTFDEGRVLFDGEDPGFPWRNQATKYIKTKLDMYLNPETPIDALKRA